MFQQMRLRRNASNIFRLNSNSPQVSPHINPKRLDKGISRNSSYTNQIDSDEESCDDTTPTSPHNDDKETGQDDDSLDDDVVPPSSSITSVSSTTSTQSSSRQHVQSTYKNADNAQGRYYGSGQTSRFTSEEERSSFQATEDAIIPKAKSNEQPSQKLSAQQRRERGEKMRVKEKKDREEKLRSQSTSEIRGKQKSSSSSSSSSSIAAQDDKQALSEDITSGGISPSLEKKKLFLKLFKSTYLSDER